MARPVERVLFAIILAGTLVLPIVFRSPPREAVSGWTNSTTPDPTTTTSVTAAASATTSAPSPATPPAPAGTFVTAPAPSRNREPAEVPVVTVYPSTTAGATTTAVPREISVPLSTAVATTARAHSTAEAVAPRRCAQVEELWRADGYPVEDPCTIAAVRRVFSWAWTGTDSQRRSAIRNGHLLDEVFAALDEYGHTHDARLFHPEERGRYIILFDDIRWHGGPEYDQAVIGVRYRFDHPDFSPSDQLLDTLVQVDGEWKLSYRRSYCVKVLVIMQYLGSDVRCPRDPYPDINEDEAPGSTGRY